VGSTPIVSGCPRRVLCYVDGLRLAAFSSWIPNPHADCQRCGVLSNLGRAKPPLLARPSSSSPRFLLAFLPLPASTSHVFDVQVKKDDAAGFPCSPMCCVLLSACLRGGRSSRTPLHAAAHNALTKVSTLSCIFFPALTSPTLTSPPALLLALRLPALFHLRCFDVGMTWIDRPRKDPLPR